MSNFIHFPTLLQGEEQAPTFDVVADMIGIFPPSHHTCATYQPLLHMEEKFGLPLGDLATDSCDQLAAKMQGVSAEAAKVAGKGMFGDKRMTAAMLAPKALAHPTFGPLLEKAANAINQGVKKSQMRNPGFTPTHVAEGLIQKCIDHCQ